MLCSLSHTQCEFVLSFMWYVETCFVQKSSQRGVWRICPSCLWWVSVCFDLATLSSNTEHAGDFEPAASSVFSLFFHPKRPNLLDMADLPHRCHGNFPQRRATLLPREAGLGARLALEAMSSETGPDLATAAEAPIPLAEQVIQIHIVLKTIGSSKWGLR